MFDSLKTKVAETAAEYPLTTAVLKAGGQWFVLSATISLGVILGARVATAGMKPQSKD